MQLEHGIQLDVVVVGDALEVVGVAVNTVVVAESNSFESGNAALTAQDTGAVLQKVR